MPRAPSLVPLWLAACSLAGCGGMDFLSPAEKSSVDQDVAGGMASEPAPARDFERNAEREDERGLFDGDLNEERLLAKLDLDGERGPQQAPGGNQPGGNQPGGNPNGGGNQQGGNPNSGGNPPAGAQPGAEGAPVPPLPLLIYTAEVYLAVYEVAPTQKAVIQHARELGGYLARQSDQEVVVRVPSRRFQDALERIEKVGDVLHRDLRAEDVSEEYRDLSIRLRNAEVVRARLEKLLEQAKNVEDALQVQRELARVTESIETLKGRLRFLQDRVAFSTITVRFAPREREPVGGADVYRLPFPWLDEVGLHSLLNMR